LPPWRASHASQSVILVPSHRIASGLGAPNTIVLPMQRITNEKSQCQFHSNEDLWHKYGKNANIAFINELVENWHETWYVYYKIRENLQ
jgi:hypothetical protein